ADAHARCYGDELRQCIDGRWEALDCALRRARCEIAAGQARCSSLDPSGFGLGTGEPANLEICDQADNDNDERIDEGGACEIVALVPSVQKGSPPQLAAEARLQDELAIINRVFTPIAFTWADRIEVDTRQLPVESGQLDRVASGLARVEAAA